MKNKIQVYYISSILGFSTSIEILSFDLKIV